VKHPELLLFLHKRPDALASSLGGMKLVISFHNLKHITEFSAWKTAKYPGTAGCGTTVPELRGRLRGGLKQSLAQSEIAIKVRWL
jgi:hypothetical protein